MVLLLAGRVLLKRESGTGMVKAGNVLLKRLLGTDAAMVGKGRGAPAEYDLSPDVDPLQYHSALN